MGIGPRNDTLAVSFKGVKTRLQGNQHISCPQRGLAPQAHLPNDFVLAGDFGFAFGNSLISFCEVFTLHVYHRQSSSASRQQVSERPALCAKP
jgi:hypothetical protein